MYILENLPWFVLFIGVLVFVHELGHFLVAKACGVKILRFSLGFGPRLFGVVRGETDYCISALPLGGYVKMLGDTPGSDVPEEDAPRAFGSQPVWQRALILVAGPGFNLLLALFVYAGLFVGVHTFGATKLGIVSVGDPAWDAGLRPGDRIVSIAGEPMRRWDDLQQAVAQRPGERLTVVYERAGGRASATIVPAATKQLNLLREEEIQGRIGVSLQYLKPIVAVVDRDSPATAAGLQTGDRIVSVAGRDVQAWHEVRQALATAQVGEVVAFEIARGEKSLRLSVQTAAPRPALTQGLFSAADGASAYTGIVSQDTVVERVDAGTPADRAGIVPGDRLLAVTIVGAGGEEVERSVGVWAIDLSRLKAGEGAARITVSVQRGGEVLQLPVQLVDKLEEDELKNTQTVRVFGAYNAADLYGTYTFERPVGAIEATKEAAKLVAADMTLIVKGLARVVRGSMPFDTMGGPIMLFVIAEKTAKRGWQAYLRMMAMISVNLGLINLFPIPVLDGGHLLFCGIEVVRRRPPSVRVRELANLVGMVVLLLLMALVFRNDFIRYVLG